MRKKTAALLLSVLLVFQLSVPPAEAVNYFNFVAAGENVLPLSDRTMPFWSGGYLYVSTSVFSGTARKALNIGQVRNNTQKLAIVYGGGRSLMFHWEEGTVEDSEGNPYSPGAIYRNGEVFVPASLVARFFNLQYSVTKINCQTDDGTINGDLVWLRQPGSVLSDRAFADAASYTIAQRYAEYQKETEIQEPVEQEPPSDGVEIEGKMIYLCLSAGEDTEAILNLLDRYNAQVAFFCSPDFLEEQGALLRRMTASGHSIGILAAGENGAEAVLEQLDAGNRALERATCGKTRLVRLEGGSKEMRQAVQEAGYRCLEPELNRSGYGLRGVANAESLLHRISEHRGNVTVWLADTANTTGLRAFLTAADSGDGHCLAWTETA